MIARSGRFRISSKYRVNFTSKLCVSGYRSQAFLHNDYTISRKRREHQLSSIETDTRRLSAATSHNRGLPRTRETLVLEWTEGKSFRFYPSTAYGVTVESFSVGHC